MVREGAWANLSIATDKIKTIPFIPLASHRLALIQKIISEVEEKNKIDATCHG